MPAAADAEVASVLRLALVQEVLRAYLCYDKALEPIFTMLPGEIAGYSHFVRANRRGRVRPREGLLQMLAPHKASGGAASSGLMAKAVAAPRCLPLLNFSS